MSDFVTVNIPQGSLRGKVVTSSTNGVTYCSFQGIPYAKPPVGPLRFKAPEDPESWTGTRDATVEGSVAYQFDMFVSGKLFGDEDCLFLNVYTRRISTTSPKAVMVWIHGGGFFTGSGNTEMYGPDFLVAEDIVLVTINYRLGPFGFLYLEGTDIAGNNTLRDQVMALKWVKKNISHFGGDPDNVTIFGESAGGISVHLLTFSPHASGLFHRVIVQSGAAAHDHMYMPHDVCSRRALRLAKALGCTSEVPQEVAEFLRTVPAETLTVKQTEALSDQEKIQTSGMAFSPCQELGPDAFLPASPRKLLAEGKFTKVPFMTGVTSAEGKLMLNKVILREKLSDLNNHFEAVVPIDLSRDVRSERSKEIAEIIKTFYFEERPLCDDTITEYVDLRSDLAFVYPTYKTVQALTKWSPHPTYVYLFDHLGSGVNEIFQFAKNDLPGAHHTAELPYLFQSSVTPNHFAPGSPDAKVNTIMAKLWTQFAKTGNPSIVELNVTWTPAKEDKQYYLKIRESCSMESDIYKRRMTFLNELYNKYYVNP